MKTNLRYLLLALIVLYLAHDAINIAWWAVKSVVVLVVIIVLALGVLGPDEPEPRPKA